MALHEVSGEVRGLVPMIRLSWPQVPVVFPPVLYESQRLPCCPQDQDIQLILIAHFLALIFDWNCACHQTTEGLI